MTSPVVRLRGAGPPLVEAFARIRQEFAIPGAFPDAVEAEAATAESRGPVTPPGARAARRDARDIDFVTIDPPGARDLDQAFHAERTSTGFRVHYAIADVAAFVPPGGAIDAESFSRGVTVYLPDGRAPMLPDRIGQGCASLLADQDRAALLWTIEVDAAGTTLSARLERATVRSRAARSYQDVQAELDADTAPAPIGLLRTIGTLLAAREVERGGVSLDLPSQEVERAPDGTFSLSYEPNLPVEGWNAQISLLAGREAARIMVGAGVGVLRTLPAPQGRDLEQLRRSAVALGVAWPADESWAEIVRHLDRRRPESAAFLIQATRLLRGASYERIDPAAAVPVHAGVGGPYAHVTAPLRRLVDRYANEIVLAHCDGSAPPSWATDALDRVVEAMSGATRRAQAVDRAVVDAAECAVLAAHVGETFDAIAIDANAKGTVLQLVGYPVIASVPDEVALGKRLRVALAAVDPIARQVTLSLSG